MAKKTVGDAVDALLAKYPKTVPPYKTCTVTRSGKRELIDALHARGVSGTRISLMLKAEFDVHVGEAVITRHSRGGCQCPKA